MVSFVLSLIYIWIVLLLGTCGNIMSVFMVPLLRLTYIMASAGCLEMYLSNIKLKFFNLTETAEKQSQEQHLSLPGIFLCCSADQQDFVWPLHVLSLCWCSLMGSAWSHYLSATAKNINLFLCHWKWLMNSSWLNVRSGFWGELI